jgi:GNAT superfamily N-acetyltransferase
MDVEFEARPATDLSIAQLAEAFNDAFAGYIVPLRFTPAILAERVVVEAIDLASSFVVTARDTPAGIVLIARRGGRARVAGMGVIPSLRRSGVGRWSIERAIRDAEARGEADLMLEVIESNPAARTLYERTGFAIERRLVGYSGAIAAAPETLASLDPSEIGRRMFAYGIDRMPWQISPEAALAWRAPMRCLALEGSAFAAVAAIDDSQVTLRAIITAPERRREGLATRLLRAIAAKHPGRRLYFPPFLPEDASPGFFSRLGFEHTSLAQLEMRRR